MDPATLERFETAAEAAREDFIKNLGEKASARDVASWIKRHYLKAGYKRLCQILLEGAA